MEQNDDNYSNDCKNRDKIKVLLSSWKIQPSTFNSDMPREPESWAFKVSIYLKRVISCYSVFLSQHCAQQRAKVDRPCGNCATYPMERTESEYISVIFTDLNEGDFRVTSPG